MLHLRLCLLPVVFVIQYLHCTVSGVLYVESTCPLLITKGSTEPMLVIAIITSNEIINIWYLIYVILFLLFVICISYSAFELGDGALHFRLGAELRADGYRFAFRGAQAEEPPAISG